MGRMQSCFAVKAGGTYSNHRALTVELHLYPSDIKVSNIRLPPLLSTA
jgi:hypothetical protein